MKILFINLCVRTDTNKKIPNIGLAYVMDAADRAGLDFGLIDIDLHRYSDEEVDNLIAKEEFDIAAFGALSSMYPQVLKISSILRRHHPESTIVLGNTLASSVSQTVLEKTDVNICILGEGENAFVDIINSLDKRSPLDSIAGIAFMNDGKYVKTNRTQVIEDLDAIPFLNFELFDISAYLKNSRYHVVAPEKLPIKFDDLVALPVNTARGCPFACTFCTNAFKGFKYRVRSPKNIVKEIKMRKEQYGINVVNFWDELTFPTAKAAEEFADLAIKEELNIYWIASVRSELFARNKAGLAIAKKLKKAGCHGLAFSLESGNAEILEAMNKKNKVEDFIKQCAILHEAEIDIYTSIIIGFPQETTQTIDETFDVLTKARVYPSVGFLQLLPGTPLYEDAINKGRITEEEYLMCMGDRQDLRINLTEYDDAYVIDYTARKLTELNKTLKMGLDENALIKTGVWKGKAKPEKSFMEDFGLSSKILRDSNFTKE